MKFGIVLIVIGAFASFGILINTATGFWALQRGIDASVLIVPAVAGIFWVLIAVPCHNRHK